MLDLTEVFSGLLPLINTDAMIILEHEAKKRPMVHEQFCLVKNRAWGFCAVSIYQIADEGA